MNQVPAFHDLESPFQGFVPADGQTRREEAESEPPTAHESTFRQPPMGAVEPKQAPSMQPLDRPRSPTRAEYFEPAPFAAPQLELYAGPQPIHFTERETDFEVESELCACAACAHGTHEIENETPPTPLTATVGMSGVNRTSEVLRVQARLVELGMNWVSPTGSLQKSNNDPTIQAIRLFQALLRGTQIWSKGSSTSPCPGGTALVSGTIEPNGLDERWLWWSGAPRWNVALPATRRNWGPASLNESGISSWLVTYLDELGPIFRQRLDALSPILDAFVTGGVPALTRILPPGPQQPGTPEALTFELINRVHTDLAQFAAGLGLNAQVIARQMLDEIKKGQAGNMGLYLTAVSAAHGSCAAHIGHQQGLEFDLRLFSHTGPQPGLGTSAAGAWLNPSYSRLLTGLVVQCILEHRYTKRVIYNDPAIWQRAAGRVAHDSSGVHNNHVHVDVVGGDKRPGPPVPYYGLPLATRPEPEFNEMSQEFEALQAEEAPMWLPREFSDYYDLIQSTVATLNARLAGKPQYTKLDPDWIRAMMLVESKPNTDARRYDPLSIAHEGDPALAALQKGEENSNSIDPDLARLLVGKKPAPPNRNRAKGDRWDYRAIQPESARLDAMLGIRGGVAWLAVKAQSSVSVEAGAELAYTVVSGDNFSDLAPKLQTTVAVLLKYNGAQPLQIGQTVKYRRAQFGWKSWRDATVAYNGCGDPDYLDKVAANYAEIKHRIPQPNMVTPVPEAPSVADLFEV